MRKFTLDLLLLATLSLVISSCGKAPNPAAKAVEDYLTALVNKDPTHLSALSCADWESSAQLELDSLQAVATKLKGLSCSVTGKNGITSEVICQGSILTTYNNDNQQLDLSARTYQVIHQGGDFLVCGYK
jgi:predicted flavoprotein YhiN